MRKLSKILLSSCICLAFTAQAGTIKTEQEIVDLFLQNNLDLIASKMQLDSSKAQAIAAQQYNNPNLSLDISGFGDSKGYSGGYWQKPYNNVLRLDQLIETANKHQLRINSAELGIDIQTQQFKDVLRSLNRDVREAYYKVVLSQHLATIYSEILIELQSIEHANGLRWKAGDISETEFQRSELEVQKAKTDLEQAQLNLSSDRQYLAQLLAHSLEWTSLELDDHFPNYQLPQISETEWIAQALVQRADYAASELSIQQKQTNVQRAEALKTPDITLGMQYQHDVTATTQDSLGVGVSVSVPFWHQYQGEVALANADQRSAVIARQQLEAQIKTQVSVAIAKFKQKQAVLKRFDDTVLEKAKQVRNASSLAYRQGAISLLELLDAERNYRNLLIEYNQAQFDQSSAWLDLMYAVGNDI